MYTYVGEAVAVVVVEVVAPAFEPAPVVVAVLAVRLADFVVVVPGTLVMAILLLAPLTSLLTLMPVLHPHASAVGALVFAQDDTPRLADAVLVGPRAVAAVALPVRAKFAARRFAAVPGVDPHAQRAVLVKQAVNLAVIPARAVDARDGQGCRQEQREALLEHCPV